MAFFHELPDEVKDKLRIYLSIVSGERVPRFVLASRIPVDKDERTWKAHDEAVRHFREVMEETELRRDMILEFKRPEYSLLDLKHHLAIRLALKCELCERRCRIDRRQRVGVCRVPYKPAVSSFFLHIGEERPLVPSGTIFFYGCNFRCVYCQNYEISWGRQSVPKGAFVNVKELAAIADYLAIKGAININRVGGEPTVYLHAILGAMRHMRSYLPQIWNSNMYLTPEAMKLIGDVIDLRLPDFKYGNDQCALKYSAALKYREIVTRNLKMAKGFSTPSVPSEGIVRHLILPGHVECCTKNVLKRLSENLKERPVNVMDQYYPTFLVPKRYPELNRRITNEEFREAIGYAKELGLTLVDRTRA